MVDKEKLLKELKEKFEITKKELGFSVGFDDLDRVFHLNDMALKDGFISESFSRQMCSRIVDTFMSWNGYLHSLIFPSPGNMISMTESKLFNDNEKKEISKLMSESMGLVSTNTLVGITKDQEKEKWFIDNSVNFWNKIFKPGLEKIMKKINEEWLKK